MWNPEQWTGNVDVSELRWHAPASAAPRRANYLGESGHRVVKAVLVVPERDVVRPWLTLTAASDRLDFERLRRLFDADVRLGTAREIEETFPDAEPGVVPAFGRSYGIPILINYPLLDEPYLLLPTRSAFLARALTPTAYCNLESPRVGDFGVVAEPAPEAAIPAPA